jgi:hypothetical protein
MALMVVAVVRVTGSCRMGRNMPRKISRLGATTSNCFYCRSHSPRTSDKTGKRIAPSTGRRRTSDDRNSGKASALGNVRSQGKKAAGFGGLAGEDGSARGALQDVAAMSRRPDTITDIATAYRIRDRGGDDPAYWSRHDEEEMQVTRGIHHAAQHLRQMLMIDCAQRKIAKGGGAIARLDRQRPRRRGKVHYVRRNWHKGVHRQQEDHNYRARIRDRARVTAICHGRVSAQVC